MLRKPIYAVVLSLALFGLAGFGVHQLFKAIGPGLLADSVFSQDGGNFQANLDAHLEALLGMLAWRTFAAMASGFAMTLLWVGWCTSYGSRVSGPRGGRSGLPWWLGLAGLLFIVCLCWFAQAAFFTVPGSELSSNGRSSVGGCLAAIPLFLFWLAAALTTPDHLRTSVPLAS